MAGGPPEEISVAGGPPEGILVTGGPPKEISVKEEGLQDTHTCIILIDKNIYMYAY